MIGRAISAASRFGLVLAGCVLAACGGSTMQGAQPWVASEVSRSDAKWQALGYYQLGQCADVLGQALPVTPERLTLVRSGADLRLVSESWGLTPVVLHNRLHGDAGNTFQAVVDGQLLEIQLPSQTRKGHWLLASHWEEWQQQHGFGARPVRVVERCDVATLESPPDLEKTQAFGLAKPPSPGYGVRPSSNDRFQQQGTIQQQYGRQQYSQ
jgi:hypothetical protein